MLTILLKKKLLLWGKKSLYCWRFVWRTHRLFCWKKKRLLLTILCKEKILVCGKNFIFAYTEFFFFLNCTHSTRIRRERVPNSTRVPQEEFKLPFSYIPRVNQRGFLISSSLVKYYIFYDFRQSLCRFN